jgi:signal transduction histidine kinase
MKKSANNIHPKDVGVQENLLISQAEYLRANLYVANVGTTSIFLVLCYFFWGEDLRLDLIRWVCVGLLSSITRLTLMIVYRQPDCFKSKPLKAKNYLYFYAVGTALAGAAFGYGWLTLIPHLSSYEQIIYLLSIVALLFGGLYAYAPFLPAYICFSALSLWISPLLLDFTREIYVTGLAFGIGLISLVSTMFAFRFSGAFKTNRELQFNIYKLLSEVTQKRDEAVEANMAKSRFLASVSHDLRQPMQAVSLSLNTLQQLILHKAGGEKAKNLIEENLAGLQHSVQYLNSMFEALLDISRIDAGVLNVQIEYQDVESLFKAIEFEFSRLAEQEGIRFELRTPPNFQNILIKTDIHLLQRLLRNLLTNAVRYTQRGTIRLSARVIRNEIDIRIIDTGVGIPYDMRNKIFDEFIQMRNPRSKDKNVGMGLGLSIARRLSTVLSTKIRLRSREGLGSVFSFKLPIRKVDNPKLKDGSPQAQVKVRGIGDLFIVVVDDDLQICDAMKTTLELYGAEVIAAESGDAAIQAMIFTARTPDLILSDYRLVGETGIECIEKIRDEFNVDIPAIIITGDTAPEELGLLRNAGLTVLHKPIATEELLKALEAKTV